MATDPLRKEDRILQSKVTKNEVKQSITLYDIDYAIMSYLEEVVLPTLDDNNTSLKVPVVYGNSERWVNARKQGVYRDQKGQLQLPILMIRRNNMSKSNVIPILNRHVSYPAITKYSKDNRYDRFALLGQTTKPKYELYNITMPDYVEINYECMAWTNFTEHLNEILEALTFASDEYWGDKQKFKFNTIISDYNIINEVGDGNQRINRIEFNLNVKAYLLPEKFDGQNNVKKFYSVSKIVTAETDATSNGRLEESLIIASPYYDNKDLIDFLSLNSSTTANPVATDTITFSSTKLVKAPGILASVITGGLTIGSDNYDVKVYINGVRYFDTTHFTATYNSTTYALTINFIAANLGFSVTTSDEVTITGKFLEL